MARWSFNKSRQARFQKEAVPHLDAAYRYARSLTRDATQADDLVQESFAKALDAFDSFEEGTNCKAWLFRIIRNTFINQIRSRQREVIVDEIPEGIGQMSGWADAPAFRDPLAAAILTATRDELQRALDGLPVDFRSAVVMSDVEGLTYQEIADVMGTPIGTVMSRLYRGRRMIRERLVQGAEKNDGGELDGREGRVLTLSGSGRVPGGGYGL